MRLFADTFFFTRREVVQLLRNPAWLIVGLMSPFLYLSLFTPLLDSFSGAPWLKGGALQSFLPGVLSLLAFSSGISLGFGTIFDLQAGVIERFRVTPASRLAILLGPLVSSILSNWVFGILFVAVSTAFGFRIHWGGLLLLAVLLALMVLLCGAFSVAVALLTKEISGFAAVINGLNLPILLLAGVLLPISLGPQWMRDLALLNPLYYLVEAARILAQGEFSPAGVWHAFAVLAALMLAILAWATGVVRRAVS